LAGGTTLSKMAVRLLKYLVAILLGNAIYFLVILPHVPAAGRHQPFKIDLGLVLDFWTCVACWGVIEMIVRRRRTR
jgi:H+/gluconate symporter-like permease